MKTRIQITIDEEVLALIDKIAADHGKIKRSPAISWAITALYRSLYGEEAKGD